jgi:hypothetical protein
VVRASVTREQFAGLADRLKRELGIVLTGNETEGSLSKDGVSANYLFDGETLSVVVTRHPFIVTGHHCETAIASALQEAGIVAEVVSQD